MLCARRHRALLADPAREVGTPYISYIYNLFINVAETHTAGVDFEASYNRQVDWFGSGAERIGVRFFANYLDEASSAFVGEPQLDRMGETSALYDYPGGWQTWRSPTARARSRSTSRLATAARRCAT